MNTEPSEVPGLSKAHVGPRLSSVGGFIGPLRARVHGLVLGAGTGQHPYLTRQEYNQPYELGAGRIDRRRSLICQTSALVLDEVIERSKIAAWGNGGSYL